MELFAVGLAGVVIGLYLKPVVSVTKKLLSNAWKEYKNQ